MLRSLIRFTAPFAIASGLSSCGGSDNTAPPPPAKPTVGSLAIITQGLPAGGSATFDLISTAGTQRFTAPDTIPGLAPGPYTITALPTETAAAGFASTVATQTVAVTAGELRTITLPYAQTTGQLAIDLEGLAPPLAGSIDVTGDGGFAVHVTQTDTLRKLQPGKYHVAAAVVGTTSKFLSDSATRDVRVDSAGTASVTVRFHLAAPFVVVIDGLPAGVDAAVAVINLNFFQTLTATTTLSTLTPGTYTIRPSSVIVNTDTLNAPGQVVNYDGVTAETTFVHYTRQSGRIAFQIQGLSGTLGAPDVPILTVVGPLGTFRLSHDTTFEHAPFGTYHYSVIPPSFTVDDPSGQHWLSVVKYSSPLTDQNLAVTLSATDTAEAIAIPLNLTMGFVTLTATPSTMPGIVVTSLRHSIDDIDGLNAFSGGGTPAPPGTYVTVAGIGGLNPNFFLADVEVGTATVSQQAPVVALHSNYHPFVTPIITVNYAGAPPGMHMDFLLDRTPEITPARFTGINDAFPGDHTINYLDPLTSGDTAAWTPVNRSTPFTAVEGQTTAIVVQLRPTNILQIVVTSPQQFRDSNAVSIAFGDGGPFALNSDGFEPRTVTLFDRTAGNVVVTANPVTIGGVTLHPDKPSQTISLPQAGKVVVTIAYR